MIFTKHDTGQPMNQAANISHYKQYPSQQPYPDNLPPPMTSVPQIITATNPAYTQQQQIYIQQQQQQIYQQTLMRRQMQMNPQVQQMITSQPQSLPPQPQSLPSTQTITISQIPPSVNTCISAPNNPIYVQTKTFSGDTIIPSSNIVDNDMFERDKQIYKCSTLRHGGKYDLHKPSVIPVPAVIPTVPKVPSKFISNTLEQQNSITNR